MNSAQQELPHLISKLEASNRAEEDAMITRRCILAAAGGLTALSAAGAVAAQEQLNVPTASTLTERRKGTMEIIRSGSQPSSKGPADYLTVTVVVEQSILVTPIGC